MTDPRIDRLAETLVRYSTRVKPGDLVGIMGHPFSPEALPLMEAVFREVLRAGGHPYPYLEARYTEELDRIFYEEGNDDQLQYLEPWAERMIRSLDCDIMVMAATNTRALTSVDSSRIAVHSRARADLFNLYLRRAAEGFPALGDRVGTDCGLRPGCGDEPERVRRLRVRRHLR